MNRRAFARALVAIAACLSGVAFAQGYPAKPIKLVVPFPPAGGTDVLSRAIAQSITSDTKWTIVIDNRPGAGGNIGLDAAAKSRSRRLHHRHGPDREPRGEPGAVFQS